MLYIPALRSLLEQRRTWFKAVAGSSAGAITAMMIAAGTYLFHTQSAQQPQGQGHLMIWSQRRVATREDQSQLIVTYSFVSLQDVAV